MVISKSAVEKAIGSIGRRDYRDPTIQKIAQKALERKAKTKAPAKSRPSRSASKIGVSKKPSEPELQKVVKSPIVKTPPIKPIKVPLLHKESVERLIGSIGRRDFRDPEIQRIAKEALKKKSVKVKKPPLVKTPPITKREKKILKMPLLHKKEVERAIGSIGRRDFRDPEIQKLAREARKGKIIMSKKGVEELLGSIGGRDYIDPEIQRIAKEAMERKKGLPKIIKKVFEKPEITKEVKVSPKAKDAVPITSPAVATTKFLRPPLYRPKEEVKKDKDVVPMSTMMGYSATEPYKLMTPEERKAQEMALKEKERVRKASAIDIGKKAFAEMKKKGTIEQFKGLLASGMRPWSYEVAGMQVAESRGEVKKGTAKRLLHQRLGEEILRTKASGVTTEGFIKRLAEAPVSVIGTPVVMAGVGSAFTGARGALAKHSTKITTAFDIVMAGMAGHYIGTRAGEIAVAEYKQKDRPKVYEKIMLTTAEIGGVALGASMVQGSVKGKPEEFKPRGLMRLKLRTTELVSKGKVIGEVNKGKLEIVLENPEGKLINVKGTLISTTKGDVSKGVVTIPKQTVEGIKIEPQKILVESAEVASIVSYGKQAKITKPVTEPLVAEGKVVGEIIKPETIIYQPYIKEGISLQRKLTFTEKGLKLNLAEQMRGIDTKSTYIVNKYLRGGKPTKAQLEKPKLPTIEEQVLGYKITPKEAEVSFLEKGVIEKRMGEDISGTRLIGKTKEGVTYLVKETRGKAELPIVEKIFINLNKNIDTVYHRAIGKKPVEKVVKKPEAPKRPSRDIDSIYKEAISGINKQREQILKIKPKKEPIIKPKLKVGRIIEEVGKIRVKAIEKIPTRVKMLSPVMTNIEKRMNDVMLSLERPKVVLKKEPIIKIIEEVAPISEIDKGYIELQESLMDIFEPPRISRPPEPPKTKPPEKITKGFPLIGIPGFPMGLDLGYSIDDHYKTITKHTKHKLATIEDLLKM